MASDCWHIHMFVLHSIVIMVSLFKVHINYVWKQKFYISTLKNPKLMCWICMYVHCRNGNLLESQCCDHFFSAYIIWMKVVKIFQCFRRNYFLIHNIGHWLAVRTTRTRRSWIFWPTGACPTAPTPGPPRTTPATPSTRPGPADSSTSWDRFHETPFRPKTFMTIVSPQILYKVDYD
jgi:hypothetical protein